MLSREWFQLALLSSISYSLSSNAIFYLGNRAGGYNMTALNFVIYAIIGFVIGPLLLLTSSEEKVSVVGTFLGTKDYKSDIKKVFTDKTLLLQILGGASATVFANICLYSAYAGSPNPGMCDAISSSSSFVSLVLGAVFLGSAIGGEAVFGMLLMAVAGYLLLPAKQ